MNIDCRPFWVRQVKVVAGPWVSIKPWQLCPLSLIASHNHTSPTPLFISFTNLQKYPKFRPYKSLTWKYNKNDRPKFTVSKKETLDDLDHMQGNFWAGPSSLHGIGLCSQGLFINDVIIFGVYPRFSLQYIESTLYTLNTWVEWK